VRVKGFFATEALPREFFDGSFRLPHSNLKSASAVFSVATVQQPKLLYSTLAGVACQPSSRCRRQRDKIENPPKPSTALESGAAVSHNALRGPTCWFETSRTLIAISNKSEKQLADTHAWIAAQTGDPLDLLRRMKFEAIGFHPIEGTR